MRIWLSLSKQSVLLPIAIVEVIDTDITIFDRCLVPEVVIVILVASCCIGLLLCLRRWVHRTLHRSLTWTSQLCILQSWSTSYRVLDTSLAAGYPGLTEVPLAWVVIEQTVALDWVHWVYVLTCGQLIIATLLVHSHQLVVIIHVLIVQIHQSFVLCHSSVGSHDLIQEISGFIQFEESILDFLLVFESDFHLLGDIDICFWELFFVFFELLVFILELLNDLLRLIVDLLTLLLCCFQGVIHVDHVVILLLQLVLLSHYLFKLLFNLNFLSHSLL